MSDAGRYRFVNGPNPCDLCDGMEGEYDYEPQVPVHPHCQCTVEELSGDEDGEDDGDCSYEVRNLQVDVSSYIEVTESAYTNGYDEDKQLQLEIDLEVTESNYDERVEEALGWDPDFGENTGDVVLPARSSGEIELEVEYESMLCIGELWKICAHPDPVAGVLTEECHVGDVGGYAVARVRLLGVSIDDTPEDDSTPGSYYDDDDEVPA